jgi:hypothetical protein
MSLPSENPPLQSTPFSDGFTDVVSVNAHVTDAIAKSLERITRDVGQHVRSGSYSLVVLGPAGGGKTHLFARLRRTHTCSPILVRPYFKLELTPRDILGAVFDQLCLPALAAVENDGSQLERIVRHWIHSGQAQTADEACSKISRILPEAAATLHLARAVLGLPGLSERERWANLSWLSGRDSRHEGSGEPLSEGDVLAMLRILAVLAAPVAPLVIVFDQLENLAGDDDARVLGYGNLVGELVDSVPFLLLAHFALTSEWLQFIEPRLSLPQKNARCERDASARKSDREATRSPPASMASANLSIEEEVPLSAFSRGI